MKAKQLEKLGYPRALARRGKWIAQQARAAGLSGEAVREAIEAIAADPEAYRDHPHLGELARDFSLHSRAQDAAEQSATREGGPAPWQQWGEDLDENSVDQMRRAVELPVAVRGALMPDAHLGYGLPIGGVLATRGCVIPYAVGVDIACRMKLTVLDLDPHAIDSQRDRLIGAIEHETAFGIGSAWGRGDKRNRPPRHHPVMDDDWAVTPITRTLREKATTQLGTSGSGNHFVEFGTLTLDEKAADLGLEAGEYLALLSHSGSRGPGAAVCSHYSKLAMDLHPELDKQQRHLAWLDLDTEEGQEYWAAMNLMGRFAAANHACIHDAIVKHLNATAIAGVENHHNFAWEEEHDGERVIVHRKGATPAGQGVLGVIPGSMAAPGFVVRGKGVEASLLSASHGAGRAMSRRKANETYRWNAVRPLLEEKRVTLLSAGLDEVPYAYKDIHKVMSEQQDLVEVIARFDPRIVKMAPAGEKAED